MIVPSLFPPTKQRDRKMGLTDTMFALPVLNWWMVFAVSGSQSFS
jgi:hypothetical protein